MDPERTSLLVTKLFADIVPGDLAVIRSLDLEKDRGLLPSRNTGKKVPCSEDPTQSCDQVEPTNDWYKNARQQRFGALIRPARADSRFKSALSDHLQQTIQNSLFGLGFRAAQGVFDAHGPVRQDVPRVVVWLSDGDADDPGELAAAANEMKQSGVAVVPIIFGQGNPEKARGIGLSPRQVRNPAELVKAFAGVFRTIVQAPYEVDHKVAEDPTFEMKSGVDEAWVIVYGDDSLGEVNIQGPNSTVRADYAADRQPGAGAYRVMHLFKPAAGLWRVEPTGGGAGVAFAVVQRSALAPILIAPSAASAGVPVTLVAGIRGGASDAPLTAADIPADLTLEAEVEGKVIPLSRGTAGDGRFSGTATFETMGDIPVTLHARSSLLDKVVRATVHVSGHFRYTAGPVDIDLGSFKAPGESCSDLRFAADQSGILPFELQTVASLPGGQNFEIRGPRGVAQAGRGTILIAPGDALQLCLKAGKSAASSSGGGEHWLDLAAKTGSVAADKVPIRVRWNLRGLTWWERWRWWILDLLFLLALIVWIYGYVKPCRFPRNLALTFVSEREELEEQSPQPIAQWKGIGIGWYRDARAYLHPNYRLSGKQRGSIASLHAGVSGFKVFPENGTVVYRETIDGEWQPVPQTGRRGTQGEAYRAGDRGPYFLVTTRRT